MSSPVVAPVALRVREALLILAVAVAAWFLLALASFSPADPGWSYTGEVRTPENLAGASGAWNADVLLSLFGYLAWLPPLALVVIAVQTRGGDAAPVDRLVLALRCTGILLTMLAGCLLAELHVAVPDGSLPAGVGAGGILGNLLQSLTLSAVGLTGVTMLALAAFLLGITLATGLSWIGLAEWLGREAILRLDLVKTRIRALRVERAARRERTRELAQAREHREGSGTQGNAARAEDRATQAAARAEQPGRRGEAATPVRAPGDRCHAPTAASR